MDAVDHMVKGVIQVIQRLLVPSRSHLKSQALKPRMDPEAVMWHPRRAA